MKPETAAALRKLDARQAKELVAFMADIMPPAEFCDALLDPLETAFPKEPRDLTGDAQAIFDELLERHGSHLLDPDTLEIDRLHEAICEGRAQDALDILTEATGENLRPVAAQNRLFPNRAPRGVFDFAGIDF